MEDWRETLKRYVDKEKEKERTKLRIKEQKELN